MRVAAGAVPGAAGAGVGGRRRRRRQGGALPYGLHGVDGSGVDFEDLFGGIFGRGGGAGRGAAGGRVPGADQEAEIQLGVEEAYRGGKRGITLAAPPGSAPTTSTSAWGGGRAAHPAGRRRRQGQPPRPAGDLYLRVRIKPDGRFRLEDRDIHVVLPVTPWEAALGATVPVSTPGGTAKVTVPAGSSSGRRLRLRGEGMPYPARGQDGNLVRGGPHHGAARADRP